MTTSHPTGFSATSHIGTKDTPRSSSSGVHPSTKGNREVGGQWGAIAAGAFTGLAVAIVMATLGAALGLSVSAASADYASQNNVTGEGAADMATGFSIGAGIWLLISVVGVGLAAGFAVAEMSHRDRPYSPGVLAVGTWALGLSLAVFLAVSGAGGLATGLGVGAAGAASAVPAAMRASDNGLFQDGARPADASSSQNSSTLTASQREAAITAAETAATAAATAAWFAFVAQLLGLGATFWAAGRRKL